MLIKNQRILYIIVSQNLIQGFGLVVVLVVLGSNGYTLTIMSFQQTETWHLLNEVRTLPTM